MTVLQPLDAEDLLYPAYQDRLLHKTIAKPGVAGAEDLRVTGVSGVNPVIAAGLCFVEQTNASQGTFFNGLYQVAVSSEANPSNSITIPTGNPQIAQVIIRVYDVNELKTAGSSIAKLEILNGTENAGATKEHIEKGEASSFGAANLPESSMRLAYILVPKNMISITEATIYDQRKIATGRQFAHSFIEAEESRENTAYGQLPKADQVTLFIPENGLVAIGYQAQWKQSVATTAKAAIWTSASTQLRIAGNTATPILQEASFGSNTEKFAPLITSPYGLVTGTGAESYTGDVATGQILGLEGTTGGLVYIFGEKGMATFSVQFKSSSGKVTVKNRKLWAEVRQF